MQRSKKDRIRAKRRNPVEVNLVYTAGTSQDMTFHSFAKDDDLYDSSYASDQTLPGDRIFGKDTNYFKIPPNQG